MEDARVVVALFPLASFFLLGFLAVLVARKSAGRLENRVFALFASLMALQGLTEGILAAMGPSASGAAVASLGRAIDWTTLALPLLFLYFALVFPYRTPALGRSMLTPMVATVALAGLWGVEASGLVDPCVYRTVADGFVVCAATPLGLWGQAYILLVSGGALVILLAKYRHARTPVEVSRGRLVVAAFTLLLLASLPAPLIPVLGIGFAMAIRVVLWALTLVFAVLVAYAILKFQTFDVEFVIRKGLSYTTTLVALTLTWVVLGELLEGVVGDLAFQVTSLRISDTVAGVGSAILVTALIAPVEKFTAGLLSHLFPHAKPTPGSLSQRAVDIYRAALEEAWGDGRLREKEQRMLATLRSSLEIPEAHHARLESEVRRQLGFSLPAGAAVRPT